jgi:Tfp pilus assembly protein PilO
MKNTIAVLGFGLAIAISSCGPSAEERAAEEQRKLDSITTAAYAKALEATQDSINKAQEAAALLEKSIQDSLARVAELDSLKRALEKAQKKSSSVAPKKTPEQKKQEQEVKEVKAATRGRG